MHTSRQRQAADSGEFSESREFNFRQRRLARAIRLAFLCGAASALPAAASCLLDGATINKGLTFTDTCIIGGTLDISSKGFLTNNGTITNQGAINSFGQITGNGTLNNLGLLTVNEGGRVQIENSGNWNVKSQTLTGGAWQVIGTSSVSSLSVGSGQILTNAADIVLSGARASFAQLSDLQRNEGTLTIEQGHRFTAASLYNTGTLSVASDGRVAISQSKNLDQGTLSGGTWQVFGGANDKTNGLSVGSGQISTNAATVLLSGANANFDQLNGLTRNTGSLTIAGGRSFVASQLANTGTLAVTSGGSVNIGQSSSLSPDGAMLNEGRWEVYDGGTLNVGSRRVITTNGADVLLSGASASFAQLNGLQHNTGTLTIAAGHTLMAGFDNKGALSLLTNEAGGRLVVGYGGILSVGTLSNAGSILNEGLITLERPLRGTATFTSKGNLTNAGTLRLQSGSTAKLDRASNLVNGTLTGGNWQIYGDSELSLGSGPISTNAADIVLSGSGATFNQLSGLTTNQGSLTIEKLKNFTAANLENTGTLTVGSGSSITLTNSKNFDGQTLTGGTWRVLGDNGKFLTTLSVGSGNIAVNAASITLSGFDSRFNQLNGLSQNSGTLSIENGKAFTLADLENTGTVRVASGGRLALTQSGNRVGGILTGGIWEVDGTDGLAASLRVGPGSITTNNADIRLRGASARFENLVDPKSTVSLAENQGSLSFSDGASVNLLESFDNQGTLTLASGGSVSIARSKNLASGALTGGTWQVIGTGAETTSLVVGTSRIVTNNATVLLSGANARFDQLNGLQRNEGSFTVEGGKIFTAGQLIHTGTLVVGAGSQINGIPTKSKGMSPFTQTQGSTRVDGLLDMGRVDISGGVLSGNGIIKASSLSNTESGRTSDTITIGNDATVQPGNSPGTLTLDGNVSFGGALEIEIASPTSFDTLLVSGQLDFKSGSTLRVLFGFTPTAAAYSFNFLQAGSIVGNPSFYNVFGNTSGYKTDLLCAGSGCSFNLAAIPEPESYAMFLAGLGMLGYAMRRRHRASPREDLA